MEFNGFIDQLANGPFLVFAFLIGLIVSIDVSVVELTRVYESQVGVKWYRRRQFSMALWHSAFHALSFFIYMNIILVFQYFVFWPIDLFDVPDGVGLALIVLINFLIVSFVWWTYRDKIKEDHSEKANDETAVDRSDMRLFVDVIRAFAQKIGISEGARGMSIAGAVAVDMLAVSALLKTYLIPNAGTPPVATLTGILEFDLFLFSSVVFLVVGGVVINAQMWGERIRVLMSGFDIIVALRLIEPFAVFVIVSGTLRHLLEFYNGGESYITGFWAYIFDAVFSVGIVFSLVISTGLTWKELRTIWGKGNFDKNSTNPKITFQDIWSDLKTSLPVFAYIIASFLIIAGIIIYSYSTKEGPNSHNHLVEATSIIASLGLLVSIVLLYWPAKTVDEYETTKSRTFLDIQSDNGRQIWGRFVGVCLAMMLFNLLNIAFSSWEATEVQAIAFWSLYVLLTMLLFDARRFRFYRANTVANGGGRVNDALFAELVSAFGSASSLIALLATIFVRTLIG